MSLDVRSGCSLVRLQRGLLAFGLLAGSAVASAWPLPDFEAHAASLPALQARSRALEPAPTSARLQPPMDRLERAAIGPRPDPRVPSTEAGPPNAGTKLDARALLGEFETQYDRAELSGRTDALKSSAEPIDGYVLEPGALFDFNEVLRHSTQANGARRPRTNADDAIRSGICQIASTLHAAVFFAGLPIVMRYPLSRPSFYIKLGLDAAVADGAQDLRFQNDRSYPIVIGLRVNDGHVYASLRGPARDHTVQFIRHIDAATPFEERSLKDASLPGGLRLLVQRGIPGFRLTRHRVVTDEISHVSIRERTRDSYAPTPQLWRVGTGREPPPDFERPRNDPRPEYVADEYLQMTQTEAGTFDVARDIGRTGSYGWIEREGMLVHKQ